MTNAQIIFTQSMELMKAGIIGTTGRTFQGVNQNGEPVTINEPEPIHTYQKWHELGYQVRRGEHAKAAFTIWKAGKGKKEEEATADGEAAQDVKMFMKLSHFFALSQVDPIPAAE